MLNLLVPNLTRRMIANIFATNIDDWPALLRALEKTGDDFRLTKHSTGTTTGQLDIVPNQSLQAAAAKQGGQEDQTR